MQGYMKNFSSIGYKSKASIMTVTDGADSPTKTSAYEGNETPVHRGHKGLRHPTLEQTSFQSAHKANVMISGDVESKQTPKQWTYATSQNLKEREKM